MSEIKKLTWRQIAKIYGHERTNLGDIAIQWEDDEEVDDPEMRVRKQWKAQGFSEKECDLLWQEHLEIGYAQQVCSDKGFSFEETDKQLKAFKVKLYKARRAKGFAVRS